ncbi:hypothetical protein MEC_01060 [Bartonella alsatica IBS 382]|uniref:Uncharacterized protein n=1 Tax=Bartonella alsatica IBS 382 TaxID=1094551 RepID=J0PPY9_9HYPH|nr:hypothetical protein MEC_01060 [Bartonella alsatica IBS 382]
MIMFIKFFITSQSVKGLGPSYLKKEEFLLAVLR